jgi:hypothetical protein
VVDPECRGCNQGDGVVDPERGQARWHRGPGTWRRRLLTGDDNDGSLTRSNVDGGGTTTWWGGRGVDVLEWMGRRSRFSSLTSARETGSRWHESSGGESSPRENSRIGVGRPPDVGLPNCRNAWPGRKSGGGAARGKLGDRPSGIFVSQRGSYTHSIRVKNVSP